MGRSIETQNHEPYTPFHERNLSGEQKRKLIDCINEGVSINREVEDLKRGFKDTLDSIAKELDVKPAVLRKAIAIAQKGTFTETNEDFLDLEAILQHAGKDSL